jgi:hypothetical protein
MMNEMIPSTRAPSAGTRRAADVKKLLSAIYIDNIAKGFELELRE